MLNSVICSGGAILALLAGSATAQTSAAPPSIAGSIPSANIGSTISAGGPIGAPGALGGSVIGSPLTPASPLPVNPSVTGSMAPAAAASASPAVVGAIVKSQSGAPMGTIARLIPGPNGYAGVVLRTPGGALREAPLSALTVSGGALVTTYNVEQINALPEAKTGP